MHLYIHIPFCASFCSYCDFYSVKLLSLREKYVEALCREIASYAKYEGSAADTIYIGGHGSLMTSSFWFIDEHTLLIGAVIWEGAPMGNDPYMLWQNYLDQRGDSIRLFVRCNYHYDPATGILTTDGQQLVGEAQGTVHRFEKLSDGRWVISALFEEPLLEIVGRRYLLETTLSPDNSAAYDYLIFDSHEEAKNYVVATLEAAGIVVDDYYL